MSKQRVLEIRRHPVKGLGDEILPEIVLKALHALPGDRVFGLTTARGDEAVTEAAGGWARCRNFVRPTTDPRLAQVSVIYDDATGWLVARHPDLPRFGCDLSEPTGGPALCDWVAPLVSPGVQPLTLRAVTPDVGPMAHFADTDTPGVSIMSRASLADLESVAGVPLDRDRFRGNVWVEGGEPWDEAEWVGKTLRIGEATFEIVGPIERCASPGANPETGERDVPIVDLLERRTGERCFGMLARVVEGGRIAERDPLTLI